MRRLRRREERGSFDHGWLETHHTFSFGAYHDPGQMGFGALRVINEDRVAPGTGFGMHGHRDMEIVTIVLSGRLRHRDSLGHEEDLGPGEVQHMSAGTGIRHAELNPSATEPVHLYQVWIEPARAGAAPRYGQAVFPSEGRDGRWQVVASPDGAEGSLEMGQDARVLLADVAPGRVVEHPIGAGRRAWLQVLSGSVEADGLALEAGDGLAVEGEAGLSVAGSGGGPARVVLFDLP
jgi:redox-sensitive bicupin YhaK (pirin superfamily)